MSPALRLRIAVYRVGIPVYKALLRVWRPRKLGVRVLLAAADGRIALVRHRYKGDWHLPGGGVHRREGCTAAAHRELREETGLTGVTLEGPLGVYHTTSQGFDDNVVVFRASISAALPLVAEDAAEIDRAGWFAPDALPPKTSGGTRRRIAEWRGQAAIDGRW